MGIGAPTDCVWLAALVALHDCSTSNTSLRDCRRILYVLTAVHLSCSFNNSSSDSKCNSSWAHTSDPLLGIALAAPLARNEGIRKLAGEFLESPPLKLRAFLKLEPLDVHVPTQDAWVRGRMSSRFRLNRTFRQSESSTDGYVRCRRAETPSAVLEALRLPSVVSTLSHLQSTTLKLTAAMGALQIKFRTQLGAGPSLWRVVCD